MPDVTRDALFGGTLSITQPAPRGGYRVNVDAILLAAFAAGRIGAASARPRAPARHAVDLGSGVGAVGLSLLHFGAALRVTMVEIDVALARLAEVNASDNGWAERVDVSCADVLEAARERAGSADLVVCNPPYVTPGRGRAPGAPLRRAKYGDLHAFVEAASRLAGRRARACFVYPAVDAMQLFAALRARGLEPKRLCPVHGRPDHPARVVLVECVLGKPGGLSLEPAFVETEPGGGRSAAATRLLSENGSPAPARVPSAGRQARS
jgi:tRNA1Val (adenine37-N6)-methyltransferase